jgi:DNA processing protein
MSLDARQLAWVHLALCGLPQRELVAALRASGDPQHLLDAAATFLPPDSVTRLRNPASERLDAALAWLAEPSHQLVTWDDQDYPNALLEIDEAPPALFYLGRRELLNRPALAIVGSRHASPQGRDDARAFARTLAAAGVTIVSGLAVGIDAAAHEGALRESGSTLAVVGTGLDRVYPAANRALAHAIAEHGGLLSEFAPGSPAARFHFPRRNRLISGLARGVLVVEATLSSGSLITARLAGDQGREVMALPGSIHSPLSRGCHKLIREGAKLVETAQDVLAELKIAAPASTPTMAGMPSTLPGGVVAEAVVAALGTSPVDLDRLIARTGLPAQDIAAQLTGLEIAGHVAALPGGLWQRRLT